MNADIIFKKKFLWIAEGEFPGGKIEPCFVKLLARPALEENELKWEGVKVTIYDLSRDWWPIIDESSHTDFSTPCPNEKRGLFKLKLHDGCGQLLETWELHGAYFSSKLFLVDENNDDNYIELRIDYTSVKYIARDQTTESANS